MPRKIYIIDNLDCANCAAKIEAKFNAHPEVEGATITFATKQLRLTAADPDALIPELVKIARTVEGEVEIHPRDAAQAPRRERKHHHHEHGESCGCGHHHDHEEHHECGCGHHHGHEEHHECGCGHHHDHEEHHECRCGHHHDHEEHHECGCGHHHDHEEHHKCGCGHHHDHEEHHECSCGHNHEHDHHECKCGHHHDHEEHHECGCGHHHEHEAHHECGCGHHHDHEEHHECGCGYHHHDHKEHKHHHGHGTRKIYIMENLGCANCAAKMEAKFNALPGVEEATITFATKQLRLTAENPDSLIPELTRIANTVEKGIVIHARDEHSCHEAHHHEGCKCGHDHDHKQLSHDDFRRRHFPFNLGGELLGILSGAALFILGLILDGIGLKWPMIVCCVAAYLILGRDVVATALKNLTRGHVFDENFLMSIATIGAFCIGEYPEAVGVMLFYRVGTYFEHRAVERSRSQIMDAVDLRPETVNLLEGDEVQVIPAAEAYVGDLLLVRPGDRIPLDGTVVRGESRIDTAPITGEPVPVLVKEGSEVISGCVNTSGQLVIRVEKELSESMVTRILDSVENAAASKPKIDRFITRFARIYTPAVVAIAAATAIIPSIATGDWNHWVYTALSFLVMSCPCALVLSVPLAFFSGIGKGSKQGILFKGGVSIEAMTQVKAVIMDKTGTITKGDFRVQKVAGGLDILKLCASCEQASTHPIGQSIVTAAKDRGMELFTPDDLEEIAGQGIRAKVDGRTILCGNEALLREAGIKLNPITDETGTIVMVAVDDRFMGYLVIADTIKEGAKEAISRLKGNGIATVMLTGDGADTAEAVSKAVGIEEVHAKLLPHQKLERLRAIRKEHGAAMFVGDGINDAPVLAGADVGAAMGSGADAAIEAADVVFMTSSVDAIPESLAIAKQTNAIAWQNVVFALVIKFAVMILGLLGFASMWLAVFADSGVAMLCVLNSIRILYKK